MVLYEQVLQYMSGEQNWAKIIKSVHLLTKKQLPFPLIEDSVRFIPVIVTMSRGAARQKVPRCRGHTRPQWNWEPARRGKTMSLGRARPVDQRGESWNSGLLAGWPCSSMTELAPGDPAAAWGSAGSGADPKGQVRGPNVVCSCTEQWNT